MLIASPNNFKIDGYTKREGALFASVVIGYDNDPNQKKGALTIHYLPPVDGADGREYNQEIVDMINGASTVRQVLESPFFEDMPEFDQIFEGIAQKIQLHRAPEVE